MVLTSNGHFTVTVLSTNCLQKTAHSHRADDESMRHTSRRYWSNDVSSKITGRFIKPIFNSSHWVHFNNDSLRFYSINGSFWESRYVWSLSDMCDLYPICVISIRYVWYLSTVLWDSRQNIIPAVLWTDITSFHQLSIWPINTQLSPRRIYRYIIEQFHEYNAARLAHKRSIQIIGSLYQLRYRKRQYTCMPLNYTAWSRR